MSKNWQEGQDPEKYSRWLLKDGREVEVDGIDWFGSPAQRVELNVLKRRNSRGPYRVRMSLAGFWKRVEEQLL